MMCLALEHVPKRHALNVRVLFFLSSTSLTVAFATLHLMVGTCLSSTLTTRNEPGLIIPHSRNITRTVRLSHHSSLCQPEPNWVLSRTQQKKKTVRKSRMSKGARPYQLYSLSLNSTENIRVVGSTSLMVLKHTPALEKEETHSRDRHFNSATVNLIQQVQQFDRNSHLEGGGGH